ncbi:MAG: 2-amino-4-hydroxy-6-hydroxymethyldihydropteridine diphosphokinase [Chloroflexota bacterium]
MGKNRAYLSLGSNIEPEINIQAAIARLADYSHLVAVSSIWETPPVGYKDQANFLNGAVIVETDLTASLLKENVLERIERELDRVRTSNKNGPRTIDLDLVLFNQAVFDLSGRKIPDPDLLKRGFIAIPMAEVAPEYIHPLTGQMLKIIAAQFAAEKGRMIRREDVV